MRRARGLRANATRDVCIFCASRRTTGHGINSPLLTAPAFPQRRNASSEVFATPRQDAAPARTLSPREAMRQALLMQQRLQQQRAAPPPPPPRPLPPLRQPQRAPTQTRSQDPWQSGQGRGTLNRERRTDPFGRPEQSHAGGGSLPIRRMIPRKERTPSLDVRPVAPQYRTTIASPPSQTAPPPPQFGEWGNLKRRSDPPAQAGPFGQARTDASGPIDRPSPTIDTRPPPPVRRKLDQAELAALLGGGSTQIPSRPYTPLTKAKYAPASQQQEKKTSGSLQDAAERWLQKEGSKLDELPKVDQTFGESEGRRWGDMPKERRSRFMSEEELEAGSLTNTRNRFEEPERRQRNDFGKKSRGRIMHDDEDEGNVDRIMMKRQRKEAKKREAQLAKSQPTPVHLPEYVSVANLSSILKVRVEDFVKKLEELGFEEVQTDHILNAEHAGLIAQEYNFEPIIQALEEDGDLYPAATPTPEEYANLPTRPPVVTIMGHVDHGKTTVLDYIRQSSVAAGEFGGITQHIGAFSVPLASGKKITFLDTPGHAAFETMRARGANVTDIVVLVVAADDSVMPQTVEAIKHANAAKVTIIVAINKIDKQQADVELVKADLARNGVEVEDYGGDVQSVNVSGKTGQGIADLEETISLQSEVLDHRADPNAKVEGWVLEGTTKKSGRVATVLVRSGTLKPGSILVAGTTWTRVRTLRNEAGAVVDEVGPGLPVEVDGWREQPMAGDEVLQANDEQQAADVTDLRQEKVERLQMAKDMEAINESRRLEAERREAEEAAAKAAKAGEDAPEQVVTIQQTGPDLTNFIVKADVSGSAEAVVDSITAIGNNEVGTRILRSGVGPPSEFDVQHAADAGGHIVNFNTAVPSHISAMAEEKGVKILDSNIIYRVVENVRALLSEKLPDKINRRVTGEAEIAAVFEVGLGGKKKLKVGGTKVRNGVIGKGSKVRVLRKDEVVFDGILSSLKNQKKDVHEMRKDSECGVAFEGWEDFKIGDKFQCYEESREKRSL
ncbi:initiation factor 2 [Amniculicola lignicola CBS 123094]|uniref:Translation initiation factor IF-2, mitochondrial n=1 Tax=Amniculicola lignicola CBS 123094 TaxID=1392246 RepID=A0A6A5X5K9_9PLEO|nr:initiation factor 2 [Amniculicola lignicola CBS 123094]